MTDKTPAQPTARGWTQPPQALFELPPIPEDLELPDFEKDADNPQRQAMVILEAQLRIITYHWEEHLRGQWADAAPGDKGWLALTLNRSREGTRTRADPEYKERAEQRRRANAAKRAKKEPTRAPEPEPAQDPGPEPESGS